MDSKPTSPPGGGLQLERSQESLESPIPGSGPSSAAWRAWSPGKECGGSRATVVLPRGPKPQGTLSPAVAVDDRVTGVL